MCVEGLFLGKGSTLVVCLCSLTVITCGPWSPCGGKDISSHLPRGEGGKEARDPSGSSGYPEMRCALLSAIRYSTAE